MEKISRQNLIDGFRGGIPIGLGYFAVAFSLGIAAANSGLTALQGFVTSLLCNASAGEYAGFTVIAADGTYFEMLIFTIVANARYLLMSAALSQRCRPELGIRHRLAISFYITDELFALNISRPGFVDPWFTYAAILPATLMWAGGTALGVIAGNVLSPQIVSALSVALYGMFIAIIIPPAKENRVMACLIALSFAMSYAASRLPGLSALSSGTRIIILTVVIAGAAALLFPVKAEPAREGAADAGGSGSSERGGKA